MEDQCVLLGVTQESHDPSRSPIESRAESQGESQGESLGEASLSASLGHHGTLLALGPLAGLTGASEGLFISPSYALLPSLLPPGELQAGNAIASAVTEGGSLVGPALGGPLVAALGPAAAFAADAASFAVSAA